MKMNMLLIFVIGIIQGFFGLTFILQFSTHLVNEAIKFYKGYDLPISKLVTTLISYIFLIICYFGVAGSWIVMLSGLDKIVRKNLAQLWVGGWFLGMVVFCLVPAIERGIKKK